MLEFVSILKFCSFKVSLPVSSVPVVSLYLFAFVVYSVSTFKADRFKFVMFVVFCSLVVFATWHLVLTAR